MALVEAGGPAANPAIHDPGRWPELARSEVDWEHYTEPQEACAGRRLYWPRGKVMGGSGALNGMVWIRGHRLDYDGWAYHGCPGWGWDDVLPVFRSLEDFDRPADELHGVGGPVRVMTRYEPHPMLAAMVAAAQEAGVPFNDDHNGETLDGVGYSQLTIRDGVRETGASAFIDPVADHDALTVHTGAQVLGLRFAGARCTGVEVAARAHRGRPRGRAVRRHARVAQAAHARRHRAGRRARAPRDRGARRRARRRAQPARPPDRPGHLRLAARDPGRAAGALPAPRAPVLAQPAGLPVPDTQPLCFHFPMYDDTWMAGPPEAYTIHGGLIRTLSRGTLRLRSADPTAPALMDPRALSAGGDVDALTASVALCREIGPPAGAGRVDGARALSRAPRCAPTPTCATTCAA